MISQQITETIYEKLLKEGEQENFDAKEILHLDTDGDKAFLIHHIVAFANNKQPSYILIGIENSSWKLVGLSSSSPLQDTDKTQLKLNSILSSRINPSITVKYQVYEIQGHKIGVIYILGTEPLYMVFLQNTREYGGSRTKGKPCIIRHGEVYVRRVSASEIASPSELVKLATHSPDKLVSTPVPKFLADNNLLDVDDEYFGINERSSDLFEYISNSMSGVFKPASSWVSILIIPLSNIDIPTHIAKEYIKNYTKQTSDNWLEFLPYELNESLKHSKTSPRKITGSCGLIQDYSTHIFYMNDKGIIEILVTLPIFHEREGEKLVDWATITGYLWQIAHFVRYIYNFTNPNLMYSTVVSLINTNATQLLRPTPKGFQPFFSIKAKMKQTNICIEINIQIKQDFSANDSNQEIESKVRDFSQELGRYYEYNENFAFLQNGDFPIDYYLGNTQQ